MAKLNSRIFIRFVTGNHIRNRRAVSRTRSEFLILHPNGGIDLYMKFLLDKMKNIVPHQNTDTK